MKTEQERKPRGRPVLYTDPDGGEQTGWYEDGHVYEDEAATVPIAEGSRYTDEGGCVWEMGPEGGTLVYAPSQVDASGAWVPAGNAWYRRVLELWKQLERRAPFSFRLNADALYRRYRALYAGQAEKAARNAEGRAAGLTGGYGSSWARNAAQDAAADWEKKRLGTAERLGGKARRVYEREEAALRSELKLADSAYEADYRRYEKDRSARASAAAKERSYAYRTAMALLKKGVLPSDETLAAAGISKADAAALARYYGK